MMLFVVVHCCLLLFIVIGVQNQAFWLWPTKWPETRLSTLSGGSRSRERTTSKVQCYLHPGALFQSIFGCHRSCERFGDQERRFMSLMNLSLMNLYHQGRMDDLCASHIPRRYRGPDNTELRIRLYRIEDQTIPN